MIGELHSDEIEAVLHRHHIGRLACVVDGGPDLVPITYAYADGAVYGYSAPGRKLDALRAEPRVCFEVDERWDDATWRSVVAEGTFEELADAAERDTALARLARAKPDAARVLGDGAVFRLRLSTKTGRCVRRSSPALAGDDLGHPVLGLDLRQGDEQNFPSRPGRKAPERLAMGQGHRLEAA